MRKLHWAVAIAGVALGCLALTEGALRVFVPELAEDSEFIRARLERQATAHQSIYVPDAELGALMAPDHREQIDTPDYQYSFLTDHAGFTNREPWPEHIDVAVLGNSLITGAGVGLDGQFTTLLEQELGGAEVLNLGLPGAGTLHQLLIYRRYARPLRPRVVVAMLWMTWEIDNSLKFNDWLAADPRPDFTEYRFTYGDQEPKAADAAASRKTNWRQRLRELVDYSFAMRVLLRQLRSWRGIPDPVERVVLPGGDVLYLSARDQKRLLAGWDRPQLPDIRRVFFEPLELLKTEVEKDGGRLLVVLFPSKEELYAAQDSPGLLQVVRVARQELADRRFAVLDLYPVFEMRGAERALFYRSDMHPNALGHRVVAEALANAIR